MNNASNAAQKYVDSLQPATLAVDDIDAHLHTFTQQQVQANVAQIAQNKSLSNCRSIIATYKNGYQQLGLTQQQFADSVKQGNTSLGKYLSTVKNGKASITGYVGYLLKAKAASIGLQMATMALNSVISLAASALLSWAIKGISDWIHAAEKAAEQAKEAAQSIQELKDSFDSLDDYKKKINDINDALDSGSLSHSEAKEKREELMSIQDEIIKKYGKEKGAIDNITDAIRGERDALDEVKKKEANRWNQEHQSDIDNSQKFLGEVVTFDVEWNGRDSQGFRYVVNEDDFNRHKNKQHTNFNKWNTWKDYTLEPTYFLKNWLSNNANAKFAPAYGTSDGNLSKIQFTGTREEILTNYQELYDAIEVFISENYTKLSQEQRDLYENLKTGISNSINYITEGANGDNAYNSHTEVLQQAIENEILNDNKLGQLYQEYQRSISAYREAEIVGNEEQIAEAYRNERDAFNALLNAARDVGKVKKEQIQKWVQDTQSEFDSATDHERLVVDVQTELKMNTGVSSSIDAWAKENQKSYEDLINEVDDKSSPIGTMIQSYVDTFNSVADEMGVAEISVEDYINALLRLGVVHKEVSAEAKENQPFVLDKDQTSTLKSINSDIDKLNDAYSKLFNNKLTDNDVYELIELFPQLGEYVDFTADKYGNLADGIDAVIRARPQDLIDELEKIDKSTLTEQGRKFLEYTLNSLKSVKAELKATESYFKNISGVISTLIGFEKELEESDSLSLSSIDTIMSDDAYKSLRPLINDIPKLKEAIKSLTDEQKKAYEELYNEERAKQYSAERVKSIQNEVAEIKKKYDIDSDNWEDLQNAKQELLINTNNEILFKQNQAINDFAKLYGIDLSNFSNAVKAKEEIMSNFYRSKAFRDIGGIVGNSLTYDPTTGNLNINDETKRNTVDTLLASQGLTWKDYLSYLQGNGFTSAGSSQMEKIIQGIIGKYTPTTINWDKTTANIKSSGGSSGSTSTTKQFFDWIERKLKKLAGDTKRVFSQVANYITFSGKNNQLSKAIGNIRSEIQANEDAYRAYMSYANSIDLDEYYKWQVRNGSMNIEQIQDTNLQEKISKYKEYYDAAIACNDAVTDLKNTEKEYGLQMLSNIETYYNNRIKTAASNADFYNSLDTNNRYVKKNFKAIEESYNKQIKETEQNIVNLRATLNWLVSEGIIKEGSDEWYQWIENINQAELSVRNLKKSVSDLVDEELKAIQTLYDNRISLSENNVSLINTASSDNTRVKKKNYKVLRTEIDKQNKLDAEKKNQLEKTLEEKTKLGAENGGIDKYSNTWYQWMNTIESIDVNIKNREKEKHELAAEEFNDIQTNYNYRLKTFDDTAKQYDKMNKELELSGKMANANYYKVLQDNQKRNNDMLKQESKSLTKKLSDAVKSGDIEEGSEAWHQMKDSIQSVNNEIDEGNLKLLEYDKTIRQIKWDMFDYLHDRISMITSESDFLIDIMSNSKLFDDKGVINKKGKAAAGLHIQNYDIYMRQADKYGDELLAINKELANDPNNTELIKRKEELIKKQQQSISAAEKEKMAVRDLVKNGIELQLESLKKLIDKYTDSIDKAKDLYTYQKNINDKTSNIAKIQKQIAAYENDTSEETRSKIQKLQVDLKEAQEDLQETEYDKFISDTKELLDDLYEDYEKTLNERLDNIDSLFGDMINTVNNGSGEIRTTIKEVANDVGATLSQNILDIWNSSNSVNGKVVADYSTNFSGKLTTTNAVLASIEKYVADLSDVKVAKGTTNSSRYMTKNIKKYDGGGLVNYTGLAQVDGTPSKPEAFLDAEDTRNISKLLTQMRVMSMTPAFGLGNYKMSENMNGKLYSGLDKGFWIGNYESNIDITIDHVQDYNDFVSQLQKDKKFEYMIQDMTVGKLNGGNTLSKNKYIWH